MRPAKLASSIATVVAATVTLAFAGDELTSLSYISYLERYATVQPANGQQAVDAVVNMPLVTGDRIDTARGARLEVQLADGSTLWVDEFTTLDLDALAASREDPAPRTVLFMQEGTSALEVPAAALGDDTVRFDYPGGTLFLSRPGLYRFDLRSGRLQVQAHAGLAEVPAGIASELLRTGQQAWLDEGRVQTAAIPAQLDDFWSWVQERRAPAPAARTTEIVGSATAGRAAALDSYGTWVYVDTYGTWAWRPYVQVGWTPYTHGRWYWTPVGWSWISYEPWGWYPYHYGSWYWDVSYGWAWCWDMVWGPAWVHWMYYPGYVGWCPRGYYDYWYYGHGYHHGGHPGGHPGGGPGGAGRPTPARWGENALDFSGQVRLRDVDPRPWNMVPANQFTSSRLERVRVDPGRVLAEAGEDARAHVRSGQLVTAPSRGDVERDLAGGLRGGGRGSAGGESDLGAIFRRDDRPAGSLPGGSTVRAVRTADLVAPAARRGGGGAAPGSGDGGSASQPGFTSPGDRPLVDLSGAPRSARSGSGTRSYPAGSTAAGGGSRGARDTAGAAPGGTGNTSGTARTVEPGGRDRSAAPRSSTPPRTVEPGTGGASSTSPRPRDVQSAPRGGSATASPSSPSPSSPPSGGSAPAASAPRSTAPAAEPAPPPARRPGYAARARSLDDQVAGGAGAFAARSADAGGSATRTYVVPFEGGRRVYQVTSRGPVAAARQSEASAASPGAAHARSAAGSPRTGQATGGSAPARAHGPAPAGSAPAVRSYHPAPSGGGSPRVYSVPSGGSTPRAHSAPSGGSAPRAAAPSSAGSSRSTGGSPSGGGRPSGRR